MSAGALTGAGSVGALTETGAFGQLKSEDFIKVLLTELTTQDPFDPQDSSALLEQLSSLRSIESQLSLQHGLEDLVLQNQVSAAGGLIGKLVSGLDSLNNTVEGLVTSVRVQDGQAILELDSGKTLAMDRVSGIALPQG